MFWSHRVSRIQKSHSYGLLGSFDKISYETWILLTRPKDKGPILAELEKGPKAYWRLNILMYVCDPMSSNARENFLYFIVSTDYFSEYDCVHLMRHESEFFEMVERIPEWGIESEWQKYWDSGLDHEWEYLSHWWCDHLNECEVVSQLISPENLEVFLWEWIRSYKKWLKMSHTNLPWYSLK